MDPEEILQRLREPGETGYSPDDVAAIIQLFSDRSTALDSLKENSQARVQQLSEESTAHQAEIQRLKAQNFDLMMRQPGIPQEKKTDGMSSEPMGIDALFRKE